MINERIEELAALHALNLLDGAGETELFAAADRDPEVLSLIEQMKESAAALAYEAPQVAPPPAVWRELSRQLPARSTASKVLAFPRWIPYALAACLAGVVVWQQALLVHLKGQYHAAKDEVVSLRARNDMVAFKLASLEAKDAAYANAKVMVAWDPKMHHGVISMQNMPAPPPGYDYQLWVLDPNAPAPMNAGLLRMAPGAQGFAVQPMDPGTGPGFAISLEPSGGRPEPTGAILFAVAPGS